MGFWNYTKHPLSQINKQLVGAGLTSTWQDSSTTGARHGCAP